MVAYPAVQDWREIARRRKNENPLYPAPTEDGHMRIWRAEVCLMYRHSKSVKGPYTGRPFLPVFSTLQNFGDANKSLYANTRSVCFGGVSGTPDLVDSDGKAPYQELPTLFGGTITILNTGNSVIMNGDRLMWALPESAKQALFRYAHIRGRPEKRIPVPVEPYRPEKQRMNADLIRGFGIGEEEVDKDDETAHGSINFLKAACELIFLGALMSDAGAFGDNAGNLGGIPATREALTQRIRGVVTGRGTRRKVLRMAQALGIRELDTQADMQAWQAVGFPMRDYVVRLIIPRTEAEYIVPLENGDMVPQGLPGDVYRVQTGAVETILSAVVATNDFFTDKIFARALTSAPPDKAVDIVIGHYAA